MMSETSESKGALFQLLGQDAGLRESLLALGGEELVKKIADQSAKREAEKSQVQPKLSASRMALEAALSVTYDEKLLTEESLASDLLSQSEALTINGARRLRLNDEARANILDGARGSTLLVELLEKFKVQDQTLSSDVREVDLDSRASAWLRDCVRGFSLNVATLARPSAEAALVALEALQNTRFANIAGLRPADLRRQIDREDWLKPMEILIGVSPSDKTDRFVGRSDELRILRSFVDVLESESVVEASSRFLTRAGRLFSRRNVASGLALVAQGGLGKSALVAKFALDHAVNSSLPFVYFDFDRASLQPKEPLNLLIEAARQISFQFNDVDALSTLQTSARNWILERESASPRTSKAHETSRQGGPGAFFSILKEQLILTSQPSARVLVVFDTLETVQSSPEAVEGLKEFLRRLCEGGFPQLRVLFAGRAEVPDFRDLPGLEVSKQPLSLGPLSVTEGREMVDKLGRSLLQKKWNSETWPHVIAGTTKDGGSRREPLTLRVLVEFVKSAPESQREEIVQEFGRLGEGSQGEFVGRIYLRRIIEHVPGEELKKVAFPGLVARRITKSLLAEVIAPLVGVDASRAEDLFIRLEREVWIVERDGNTLVHRPELRSKTLPFMWRHDREKFNTVAVALRDYFKAEGNIAEEAYYRLLLGENPNFLEGLPDECLDRLRPSADDFSPAWSENELNFAELNRAYLRSRSGPLMSAVTFKLLPTRLAIGHLARAGNGLRSMDDTKVSPILVSATASLLTGGLPNSDELILRQTLLIKTGEWSALRGVGLVLPKQFQDAFAFALYIARSGEGDTDLTERLLDAFPPESGSLTWRIRALLLPWLHVASPSLFERADRELSRSLPPVIEDKVSDIAALNSILVCGSESYRWAMELWSTTSMSLRKSSGRLSAKEAAQLVALMNETTFGQNMAKETSRQVRQLSDQYRQDDGARSWVESLATGDLAAWLADQKDHTWASYELLQRLFAARHPDWIMPVGYLIASTLQVSNREIVEAYLSRLENRQSNWSSILGLEGRGKRVVHDGLWMAREADSAGDLLGLLELVAGLEQSDKVNFMATRLRSWDGLINKLATPQA